MPGVLGFLQMHHVIAGSAPVLIYGLLRSLSTIRAAVKMVISVAHRLFGGPATSQGRPVALRPRLAVGLPFRRYYIYLMPTV